MKGTKGVAPIAIALVIIVAVIASVGVWYVTRPPAEEEEEEEYPEAVMNWADMVKERYEGITVNVAAISHPSTSAFTKMTPEFERLTGVNVNWIVYEETKYFDKILLIASGEVVPYDIMFNCAEICPYFGSEGLFAPVNDLLQNTELTPEWHNWEDLIPAYRAYMTCGDEIYGPPIAGESIFVAYNKDLFEEYDKVPPTTYDELLDLAKFFKEEVPDVAGISIRAKRDWEAQWSWISFAYGYGGEFVDLDTMAPKFSSPETVASLEYFCDLIKYGPVGIESFSFEEAWTNFMLGKSAMLVESTAAAPGIEDPEKSMVAGKVGYVKMPSGPAGPCAGVWGWGLSMPSVSVGEIREAAWCLMVWLTSEFNADTYLEYGGIVSRTSCIEKLEHVYDQAILDALEVADSPLSHNLIGWYSVAINLEAGAVISAYVAEAEVGAMTPEAACAKMDEEVGEMLQ